MRWAGGNVEAQSGQPFPLRWLPMLGRGNLGGVSLLLACGYLRRGGAVRIVTLPSLVRMVWVGIAFERRLQKVS